MPCLGVVVGGEDMVLQGSYLPVFANVVWQIQTDHSQIQFE